MPIGRPKWEDRLTSNMRIKLIDLLQRNRDMLAPDVAKLIMKRIRRRCAAHTVRKMRSRFGLAHPPLRGKAPTVPIQQEEVTGDEGQVGDVAAE